VAEEKENVIVIEPEEENKKNKLPYIIIILLLLLLIMLLILLAVVVTKKRKEENQNLNIQQIVKKLKKKKNIPKNELDMLIKKATILYNSGQKEKALEIFAKISQFSESLSNYNLGVLAIKEKHYKKALNYFQKAIDNGENRAISAINATYCALMLKNKKLFDYYKNLAYTFLPEIAKNKNYPYYYALVMYYMGYEYETIPALKTPTAFYKKSKQILANIYEYYNDPKKAARLENSPLYKGLDYARSGNYYTAADYLKETNATIGKFALALVDLKISRFKQAAIILRKFKNNNIYPINVFLKKSLFDIKTAQKNFEETFLKRKTDFYDLYFYFAPYKVYDINQTINFLKKGLAGIPLGAVKQAQNYLSKSAGYSKLNLQVTKAIKLALNGHIYLANKMFIKLAKKHNSYIMHYDLALTYAQLGEYYKAYEHFLRAYHLNPYDLTTGILALYAAQKVNISNPHLTASISNSLTGSDFLQTAMLAIYQNDRVTMAAFLEKTPKNKPFWLISRIIVKSLYNKDYTEEASMLKDMYPKDLIANLLYFYANNKNLPINRLAQNYQSFYFLITRNDNLNEFYYGAKIAKDWFFEFAKISGLMNRVRNMLLKKAQSEIFDIVPVFERLAYADLFTKHFEESYTIYNDLINNKGVNSAEVLYQAAVAAIGAGHHANAVALMELAKLKNPKFFEARYGLGLLWQESGDLVAASIQYAKIPDTFTSRYFDFNIKH
jgi:tetratricopeptide (TPR) repeat protein